MSTFKVEQLPLEDALRIDRVCDEFEAAWNRGEEPCLEDFLTTEKGDVRAAMLRSLLLVMHDLGQLPSTVELVQSLPADQALIEEVADEVMSRQRRVPTGVTEMLPDGTDRATVSRFSTKYNNIVPPSDSTPFSQESSFQGGHRFSIERRLGAGGMGEVFIARDRDLCREIALKTARDWKSAGLFVREAQITAQLPHPNIMPVYDFGAFDQKSPFIAMPLIEGGTFSRFLDRYKGEARLQKMPFLIDSLLKVCDAVSYAHHKGVIHRDIKPSNILIGRFGEVQLADWGLAIQTDESDENIPRIAGTPQYMAPEQMRGNIGERTDVFALGGILYQILFDAAPNPGKGFEDIKLRMEQGVAPGFSRRRWPVPLSLVDVCRKALAYDPEKRYQTASEFADAIRQARQQNARGAGLRVILGLVAGVTFLTMSLIGWCGSWLGLLNVHWLFWAAIGSCAAGLTVATFLEAIGYRFPPTTKHRHEDDHRQTVEEIGKTDYSSWQSDDFLGTVSPSSLLEDEEATLKHRDQPLPVN